jgi:hypothetical protein
VAWIVGSDWEDTACIDDAVNGVISQVWPYRKAIAEFVERNNVRATMDSAVRLWNDPPDYSLTRATLKKLVELGVEFSLHIYDYSDSSGGADEAPV